MALRPSEAETGGQWNFSGVLYQLLVTLSKGLTATLEMVSITDETVDARIVVEPVDGGDARHHIGGEQTVDQIKIRRGQRPWSTQSIVHQVLPDLFKAAHTTPAPDRYRFLTDNLAGTRDFCSFLEELRTVAAQGGTAASLARRESQYRWGHNRTSAQGLFKSIKEALGASETDAWRFLIATEIEGKSEAQLTATIDTWLEAMVSEREEIPLKRRALLQQLLQLGASGGSITVSSLLRANDIDAARLTLPVRLPALLKARLENNLNHLAYESNREVRSAALSFDAPISILSGESGQGKTWRLCQAALAAATAGHCVIWLAARGRLRELEDRIVEWTWGEAFDKSPALSKVAARLRPKLQDAGGVWLTVFLDDLSDPDLASELRTQPWQSLGIRTVISAQTRIVEMLRDNTNSICEIQTPNFTLSELHAYLLCAGRDPTHIRDDVLLTLVRPILAFIYCKIDGSDRWTAVSEYQLMRRYWEFATTLSHEQRFYPADRAAVLRLVGTLLDSDVLYPWPASVLHRQQMTEPTRERLVRAGLLLEDISGTLTLAHDRVLNWAVALEIERRHHEGEVTLEAVAEILHRLEDIKTIQGEPLGRRLGYATHDLLWMLASRGTPLQVGTLVRHMYADDRHLIAHDHFFEEGLGSMGTAIIPALNWLAQQCHSDPNLLMHRLPGAYISIAQSDPDAVAEAACVLVRADVETTRNVGLRVLRAVAAPGTALDLLWSIHRQRYALMQVANSPERVRRYHDQESTFDALATAVRQKPQWLQDQALAVSDAQDADQLLWLLLRLEGSTAKQLWQATKHRLLASLSPTAACIPRAIRRFRDKDELPRIKQVLQKPLPQGAAHWFDALAYLAPDHAVEILDRFTMREFWGNGRRWLTRLLYQVGPQVQIQLAETIGADQPNILLRYRDVAMFYQPRPDQLDSITFDRLLDALENCLGDEVRGIPEVPGVRHHLLRLAASATTPPLLERLAARRGSNLERLVAKRVGAFANSDSFERQDYQLVLSAIGGDGYDACVLAWLSNPAADLRYDGLEAALWTRDPAVTKKLESMANGPLEEGRNQYGLVKALAAHRADAALCAVLCAGAPLPLDAVALRSNDGPWAEKDRRRIAQFLRGKKSTERQIGIQLCLFLDVETAGTMLAPWLEDLDAPADEAELALKVLMMRSYYRPSFLPSLKRMMLRDDMAGRVAEYFISTNDPTARSVVADWLEAHPLQQLGSVEVPLARYLLRHEDSRAGALEFLYRVRKRGLGWGCEGTLLSSLAAHGDQEAAAALESYAYQHSEFGADNTFSAIRALARTSAEQALVAAERYYRQTRSNDAAFLLMEINAENCTHILLEDYLDAPIPVCHAIGRLLRCSAPRQDLLTTLKDWSQSETAAKRRGAAELAGWLPSELSIEWLAQLVDDEDEAVETAALQSLRQRQGDADCAALIENLLRQPRSRQWAWLHALIERSDPAHLRNSEDPRSIHDLLNALGEDFRDQAETWHKRRADKLKSEAQQLEKNRLA